MKSVCTPEIKKVEQEVDVGKNVKKLKVVEREVPEVMWSDVCVRAVEVV